MLTVDLDYSDSKNKLLLSLRFLILPNLLEVLTTCVHARHSESSEPLTPGSYSLLQL